MPSQKTKLTIILRLLYIDVHESKYGTENIDEEAFRADLKELLEGFWTTNGPS